MDHTSDTREKYRGMFKNDSFKPFLFKNDSMVSDIFIFEEHTQRTTERDVGPHINSDRDRPASCAYG